MSLLKKHKILAAVIVLILLAGVGLLYYKLAVLKSPEKILTQYMACIEEKNYASMYEMLRCV